MGRYQGTEDEHPNVLPGIIMFGLIFGGLGVVAAVAWPDTSAPRIEMVCVSTSLALQVSPVGVIPLGSGMGLMPVSSCDTLQPRCVWGADYTGPRKCAGKPENQVSD